jgi:hypothetical protein
MGEPIRMLLNAAMWRRFHVSMADESLRSRVFQVGPGWGSRVGSNANDTAGDLLVTITSGDARRRDHRHQVLIDTASPP